MDFSNIADDFFVNLNVQTTMKLPDSRETVLHFFEAAQKEFGSMASFFQRETGEFVLEGDRDAGKYRWCELHPNRLCAGYFNPPSLQEAYHLHRWLLERSQYYLGISGLDIEALDLLFGFNLDYQGNRDGIVADALLGDSPLAGLCEDPSIKPIEFEPNMVVSLDEECYLQGRVSIETRSTSYQVRTGQYDEEPISVYFTVRRYPAPSKPIDMLQSFQTQCELCEDITGRIVIPRILQPIAEAIATQ
jgi:hypothetical protein